MVTPLHLRTLNGHSVALFNPSGHGRQLHLGETQQAHSLDCSTITSSSHHPQVQPCPYDPASNWRGASDASAHPDGRAYIGGWLADKEDPRTTHGGSTTKYHWRITLGPTKTVTQPVGFPVWKCSALPSADGKQSSAPYSAELDFRQPGQHLRTPQPEDQANAHFCLFDAAHRHAP